MSTSIKSLLIAAMAILALFLIGHHFGFKAKVKEPRSHVIELDTTDVAAIHFEDHADPGNDFFLRRGADGWMRSAIGEHHPAPEEQAATLLARFRRVMVERDMGMILLLGERYHLTDSMLCRISFSATDGSTQALNLGSSTFAPGKVGAWTYVNIPGEREVYAVEGLMSNGLRK